MDWSSHAMRRSALRKLATLSANAGPESRSYQDLDKLGQAYAQKKAQSGGFLNGMLNLSASSAQIPMGTRELECLLALCQAAPAIQSEESADKLLKKLLPYLLESHSQQFVSSAFLREIDPSPWEALSYNLTLAVLSIGRNHAQCKSTVLEHINNYLDNIQQAFLTQLPPQSADAQDGEKLDESNLTSLVLSVSLLGFMEASAVYADFWTTIERNHVVDRLRQILSGEFLVAIETSLSAIRTAGHMNRNIKEWKRYSRHYSAIGRPLGAMLLHCSFMRLLVATTSLLIADASSLRQGSSLDIIISGGGLARSSFTEYGEESDAYLETLVEILIQEMNLLDDGADFLRLGSTWQQRLGFAVKSYILTSYTNCVIVNEEIADIDVVMGWLDSTVADAAQMADETLSDVVLKCMVALAKVSGAIASDLSKTLPRFIVQSGSSAQTVNAAAYALAQVLKLLSQDAMITTLYTLGNVLSAGAVGDKLLTDGQISNGNTGTRNSLAPIDNQRTGSAISLALSGDEEYSLIYGNVIRAIVNVASNSHDAKIAALAQSMLIQKVGKTNSAVDCQIITEVAILGISEGQSEFRSLLKSYAKLSHETAVNQDESMMRAIVKAYNCISSNLSRTSTLYNVYLVHLLEMIISKGDLHDSHNSYQSDVELATLEITLLLQPLAILMAAGPQLEGDDKPEDLPALFRDAWFNIIVHDISPTSEPGSRYASELRLIAKFYHTLTSEHFNDAQESDVELNSVLRRGSDPQHTTALKKRLVSLLPGREADVRGLSHPKVVFLLATYVLEVLRVEFGECTHILAYFLDSSLKSSEMENCMLAICNETTSRYLRNTIEGTSPIFSAPNAAKQLAKVLTACCHRIDRVQKAANFCAEKFIAEVPSVLCQKSSLFALLELLSMLWTSYLEGETDEYDWKPSYTSRMGKVTIELSDNFTFRKRTLDHLYVRAKIWIGKVIEIAPLDVKGLLQTYLSEYDDDGAYGHVSLGRSLATEMGSQVPISDQRLRAIDRNEYDNFNLASDFVAQYTTRQEYRHADPNPEHGHDWLHFMHIDHKSSSDGVSRTGQENEDLLSILIRLESRTTSKKFVSYSEIRENLRRAAAVLCRSTEDQCSIVHFLVAIPFSIFTRQSIKLGISLWLGVINENPMMEPRLLSEIAQSWEATVRLKRGIFDTTLSHLDPFFVKEEFAPSDKPALLKQQQRWQAITSPHIRVLQFLNSHFQASLLRNPNIQSVFFRLVMITLKGLTRSSRHPLVRELHFQIILFSLRVFRQSIRSEKMALWRLKDLILTAALSWFTSAPKWSFGSNRLQIKAEAYLLEDVGQILRQTANIFQKSSSLEKALQAKQDLLLLLIVNEVNRLVVWLSPIDHEKRHQFETGFGVRTPSDPVLSSALRTAWAEDPNLAVHLAGRFQSQKVINDVRWLLINFPQKVMDNPDALQILIGSALPTDISFQLKFLLYWAPVNPITAVTYFLPSYGNQPYILQYAMRALESHSVDVTFFYVPQIVQTLRYDSHGYVERYIVETAKVSQLFAHQIIWNMKANAYKDEDSQVPDSIKPVLDRVMSKMTSGFSGPDQLFYEREFSFFNEVTDVSGKLRPFIKASKPEKKQKIEEELRKIKVEIGVYLPSNPDGVVIGIDRKSGKPLQSHAKAPYMATFRIKKNKGSMEGTEDMLEKTNRDVPFQQESTIEVWQSAIFKVGDDCRQDVLALQLIAAFRGIFNNIGLDVFVYPYRVTATAPGCGVIDVLPNSISRDMLGREAVNGLYDYFVSKYGGEDSIAFQEARNNFVKSMAAYSVISYLLQFKDRHNGNIMIDDAGHILHIDFGFCFDIAPGGVKFERAPFKLTGEMVAVMGGNTDAQPFRWFEQLCVKAFLASRQYCEKLSHLIILMLDSGLPCFKPETMQNFRDRFVLDKSEREAADFMRGLIKRSEGSTSTTQYDRFQLWTNGIPY